MNMLKNVKRIVTDVSVEINDAGLIICDEDASITQKDGTVTIKADYGSTTNFGNSALICGGQTIISNGSSSMTVNGIRITSIGNSISLSGPATTKLIVNGVPTTFGSLCAIPAASATPATSLIKEKKLFHLDASCAIEFISAKGYGTCRIAAQFCASNLNVNISGSGDVVLPDYTFQNLTLSIAGSGDIQGSDSTLTDYICASVAGSGDIKGIGVLGSGTLTVVGSGDISLCAKNPDNIERSAIGSGRIRVSSLSSGGTASKKRSAREVYAASIASWQHQ